MRVFACRLFSWSTSRVLRPCRPAIELIVSPRTTVYSAGVDCCRKAVGREEETAASGMTPDAAAVAACAFIAAASEERTTAGRAAVVAARRGRLGLWACFGERDVVMSCFLFLAANYLIRL